MTTLEEVFIKVAHGTHTYADADRGRNTGGETVSYKCFYTNGDLFHTDILIVQSRRC